MNIQEGAVPLDEFANRLLRRPVQYIVVEVPSYILYPYNVCAFGGFGVEAAPVLPDPELADRLLRELAPERPGLVAMPDELVEAPCVRSECSQHDGQGAIDLPVGGYQCEDQHQWEMPPEAPMTAKQRLAAIAWRRLLGNSAVQQPAPQSKRHGKKPKNRQSGRSHRDEGGSAEAVQHCCRAEDSTWPQSWGQRLYPMRRPTARATALVLCGLLLAGAHFGTGLLPQHTGVKDTARLVDVLGGRETARPEGVESPPTTTSEISKASRKEFARWLRDFVPDIEPRDIRSAFRTADVNGDGIVDQEEADMFAEVNL